MSWAGGTQESLWEAFQGCLVPCLGSSAHSWLSFLGSPDCVLLWSLEPRTGGFQHWDGERPQLYSLSSFTLRSFQGSLILVFFQPKWSPRGRHREAFPQN